MSRNTRFGLLGVLGIWLTAGIALPIINGTDLKVFSPYQLMFARGLFIILFTLGMIGYAIRDVDKYTYLIGLVLPFATLGLYQGVRHWGAGPTIIIVTATPLINFLVSWWLGRKIPPAAVIGFALLFLGVTIAQRNGHFQWRGFGWSVFGTIMNGILYELFSRAKATPSQKCFWGSLGMATFGFIACLILGETSVSSEIIQNPRTAAVMIVFVGVIGGWLYWMSNTVAFVNLETPIASVLAQGEAPAVLIGAYFILGEQLTTGQCFGIVLTICGAGYLSYWLAGQEQAPALA